MTPTKWIKLTEEEKKQKLSISVVCWSLSSAQVFVTPGSSVYGIF